jgi:hypothetical protein
VCTDPTATDTETATSLPADPVALALADLSANSNASLWERQNCTACGKTRKFYCPECLLLLPPPGEQHARLGNPMVLPLHVDILLTDARSKATGLHAKVLAPKCVTIRELHHSNPKSGMKNAVADKHAAKVPCYSFEETLVVFPSSDSVHIDEVEGLEKVNRLILVESTWKKTVQLLEIPQVKDLRRVRLRYLPPASHFWRWHAKANHCVSTIEALFCVLLEHRQQCVTRDMEGVNLSNLLLLFSLQHSLIKQQHDSDPSLKGVSLPMSSEAKQSQVGKRHISKQMRAKAKQNHFLLKYAWSIWIKVAPIAGLRDYK